jgi:ribose transport system permease protein
VNGILVINKRKVINFLNNQRIFLAIVIIVIYLGYSNDIFLKYANIINILFQVSINGIIAIGMAFLLISREFDLSVGSNMALVGTCIILLQNFGLAISICGGLLAGMVVGVINGLLVTKLKIPSLPATLGTMVALKGVVILLTKAETLKGNISEFTILGNGTFYTIPYAVIFYISFLLIFGIILAKSIYGRNIYAIGGNPVASRYFGINVERVKFISFLITGLLVGISGIITASRLNIASVNIGSDAPIFVITAVILGGISIMGGEGNVFKSFQGILLLGIIANAMRMIQIHPSYQILTKGILLILIIGINGYYVKISRYKI